MKLFYSFFHYNQSIRNWQGSRVEENVCFVNSGELISGLHSVIMRQIYEWGIVMRFLYVLEKLRVPPLDKLMLAITTLVKRLRFL